MIKSALFAAGFILTLSGHCQNINLTDSLIQQLENGEWSVQERHRLFLLIAHHHPDPLKALEYARSAQETAHKSNDLIALAETWEEIGYIDRRMGNNTRSMEATLKALQVYEQKKTEPR